MMNINELQVNDFLKIHTRNSTYLFKKINNDKEGFNFEVSGGYFDKKGYSPDIVRINGSTFGGSSIKINYIGLTTYLEVVRKKDNKIIRMSYTKKIEFWNEDI